MNDKCFGNATRCKVSTAISNSNFQTFTTVLSTLIENIFNSQEKTMKIFFHVYNWIIRGHFFSQSGLVFSRLFNSKTEAKATLICFQKAHWRFGLFSPFHTNMFSFRSAFFLTHFCLKRCADGSDNIWRTFRHRFQKPPFSTLGAERYQNDVFSKDVFLLGV